MGLLSAGGIMVDGDSVGKQEATQGDDSKQAREGEGLAMTAYDVFREGATP